MESTTTEIIHPDGTTIVTTSVLPVGAAGTSGTEATLISGTAIAKEIRAELAEHVVEMKETHGILPGLAVVLVGERPDSAQYVRMKKKVRSHRHHCNRRCDQTNAPQKFVLLRLSRICVCLYVCVCVRVRCLLGIVGGSRGRIPLS